MTCKAKPIPWLIQKDIDRFWAKVSIQGTYDCWDWTAFCDRGYGRFRMVDDDGYPCVFLAHRIAFYLGYKQDPGDLKVCHSCDNSKCCNPVHLWCGTQGENLHDARQKGRLGRFNYLRGEKHYAAILTNEDVLAIRASTEKQIVLAARYKVSPQNISSIKSGRSWKHLLKGYKP